MSDLIKKLEEYFATTPREKVLEDWEKSKEWDEVGPTFDKYYKMLEKMLNKKKMGTKLFKVEDVNKFFNKLYSMGRVSCTRYDKLCEREVFVRRTVNKYLKGCYVVLYVQEESSSITYKRYVSINSIDYALDYGNNLIVYIADYARPYNFFNSIKIGHNEALKLEGLFTDGKEHKLLYKLTSMEDAQSKEFVYVGYDFTKYPARKKKGQTEDDIRELMRVEKIIVAKVEAEADKQIKKLQGKDFLLQGLKEVREYDNSARTS